MKHVRSLVTALAFAIVVAPLADLSTVALAKVEQDPPQAPAAANRRAPRPYDQVITDKAKSERGVLTVHKVDERYFFEIDNAMLGRDFLLVSRISGVPAGSGGFQSAGSSVAERMVRWDERDNTCC